MYNLLLPFLFASGSACDPSSQICPGGLPNPPTDTNEIQTILGIVFGVIGALSLLFITISGMRYAIANGEPDKLAQARQGIIYALIGLVISIGAEVLVAFVVGHL